MRIPDWRHYYKLTKNWLWNAFVVYKERSGLYKPKPTEPNLRYWSIVFVRKMLHTLLGALVLLFIIQINFLWLFGSSPDLSELENPQLEQASELYSSDGLLLGRYYKENRSTVRYEKLSPHLVHALLATEDIRFYKHSGIDILALPSIAIYTLRGDNRGGSTITQQLAKNLYKTREGGSRGLLGYIPGVKTIIIKLKEWITAVKLERRFTKEEIIALYLNTVDFGSNAFGIKTASSTFFSRSTEELNPSQSAMLIGLLKATTAYNPVLHPKAAITRRNVVLSQMHKYGFLSDNQLTEYTTQPLALKYHIEKYYDGPGTYFRGVLNKLLKDWCDEHGYNLYTSGLKIYTTIDSRMQEFAEEAVEQHMKSLQQRFNRHWKGQNPWIDENKNEIPGFLDSAAHKTTMYKYLVVKYKGNADSIQKYLNKPKKMTVFSWDGEQDTTFSSMDSLNYYKRFLHTGFMVMEPKNGQIKAWVGGINYKYFQYDHVYQSKRQPGSSFKPIMYAAAFESGWGPCDTIPDVPITVRYMENGEEKTWSPHNADYNFSGTKMTLRRAMGKSVNSVAAQLTQRIGIETVIKYARLLGIESPLRPVPSIGLGSSDVSVYELTGAYATFMNQGVWTQPQFITRITDRYGKVLATFTPPRHKAISEESAFLMTDMLKAGLEEVGGTSQELWVYDLFHNGNELGGKTGTSSNHSDGWFVGVSKDLVGCSWVGGEDRSIHFRTSSMGEGMRTALPIYGLFMEKVYKDQSLGYTFGRFPKPAIKITKKYNCRTYVPRMVDSTILQVDSTGTGEGIE